MVEQSSDLPMVVDFVVLEIVDWADPAPEIVAKNSPDKLVFCLFKLRSFNKINMLLVVEID